MPDLSRLNRTFYPRKFRTTSGTVFEGVVGRVPVRTSKSQFEFSRSALYSAPGAVTSGQVFEDQTGTYWLIAEPQFPTVYRNSQWALHPLFPVPYLVSWKRPTVILDPVAKVNKRSGVTDLGLIRVGIDPLKENTDGSLRVDEQVWRIVTSPSNSLKAMDELTINSNINRVLKVQNLLGVTVAELET